MVQRVYSTFGVLLPRDAYMQAQCTLGNAVPEGVELRTGDLVFFGGRQDPRKRGITHVGLMLDKTRMIHASGNSGVTIQALDDPEILNSYTCRGTWRLRSDNN